MDDGDSLAPVIPLFGGSRRAAEPREAGSDAEDIVPRRTGDAGLWRSTWHDPQSGEDPARAASPSVRHPARSGDPRAPRLRALHNDADARAADTEDADPQALRADAGEMLVRKLRTRSLSVSEARMVLKGYERDAQRLDAAQIDDLIDDFCRRGYLDDALLADQLVTSGAQRKGQGRVALSRALAQRGIPRDVIDAALEELPDDDYERALEFARTKMRSLGRLDQDTATRRLSGQLARRGYAGNVVSAVVRAVMGEQFTRGRPSGVRFE